MRLAVVTDDRVCRVRADGYYTAAGYDWNRVADLFGADLDRMTIHCRIFDRDIPPDGWGELTTGPRVRVADLPWFHKYQVFARLPQAVARLVRAVRRADVVLLIVPSVYPTLAYVVARGLRVPVIAWCVGDVEEAALLVYDELPIRLTHRAYGAMTKRIVRKADVPVVASRLLAAKYEVQDRAVVAYRSFTDPAAMQFQRPAAAPPGATIVTVARLSTEKGIATLIEAMPLVVASVPGARLALAGDGPQRGELEGLVGASELGGYVDFLGWVPRGAGLRGLLADAAVFCLPSYTEGMPAALIEALWASLPCVVTDVGDMGLVVARSGAGIVVPAKDPQRLAAGLVRLLTEPSAYAAAVNSARETARELSFEAQTGRVAAAAMRLIASRKVRAD